ncbi:MAG: citrate (Si)-synthase, partial [Chlorobiaceae bacterium]|nr:citrate (Si)-synthase [Chlorobiaceae bacterium]
MAATESRNSLTVTDNRTGKIYEVPIENGAILTSELRKIKTSEDDFGLLGYDPGFMNTASCKSSITYIDGDKGILRYRGYPIEQLAEKSTFLETAYLLIKGMLPDKERLAVWTYNIRHNTLTHSNMRKFMDGFRYDAHPMGILVGTIGALSTFYPDAKDVSHEESRKLQVRRLIGKIPT